MSESVDTLVRKAMCDIGYFSDVSTIIKLKIINKWEVFHVIFVHDMSN